MASAKKVGKEEPKKSKGMSLDDINNEHNPNVIFPRKIKTALTELGDAALPEDKFREFAKIGAAQLALYRPQFKEHLIEVKRNGRPAYLWAGTTEFAQAAREELEK